MIHGQGVGRERNREEKIMTNKSEKWDLIAVKIKDTFKRYYE